MNKSYVQEGNNVTIYTDGGVRIKDYTDNIGEILIQENVVEELENKTNSYKDFFKSLKFYKRVYKYILIAIPIFSVIILGLVSGFNILGFLGLAATFIPVVLIGEAILYPELKKINKNKNAVSKTLDYLEKSLDTEKEKLQQLKNNKTNKKIKEVKQAEMLNFDDIDDEELENEEDIKDEIESKKIYIYDVEILKSLKREISFNYKFGYNEELYYKYYDAGILNEKLQDEFTEEEIEQINTYFENAEVQTKNHKSAKRKHKVRA